MRERIDVSEIEAQTKIRAKYLRALENEEWSLLPGPTFVKSFLRTYAQALGLDDKALVEEYRLHHEKPSDAMLEPIVSSPSRNRSRGRSGGRSGSGGDSGPSRGYVIAVGTILAVIVLLIVLLVTGGKSGSNGPARTAASTTTGTTHKKHAPAAKSGSHRASSDIVALSLTPTSAVYVCLIDEAGHKLIPGEELQAGQSTPTYHAKHFEITLGNNAVTLYIDGRARTVPPSASAIGYSISKARGRHTLPPSQQPTCK